MQNETGQPGPPQDLNQLYASGIDCEAVFSPEGAKQTKANLVAQIEAINNRLVSGSFEELESYIGLDTAGNGVYNRIQNIRFAYDDIKKNEPTALFPGKLLFWIVDFLAQNVDQLIGENPPPTDHKLRFLGPSDELDETPSSYERKISSTKFQIVCNFIIELISESDLSPDEQSRMTTKLYFLSKNEEMINIE